MSNNFIVNKYDKYQLKIKAKRNNEWYPLKITIITNLSSTLLDNYNFSIDDYEERIYDFNVDFTSSSFTIRIEGTTPAYGSAFIDHAKLFVYYHQSDEPISLTQVNIEGSDMDSAGGWTTTGPGSFGSGYYQIEKDGKIEKTITFNDYSIITGSLFAAINYKIQRTYIDTGNTTSNILTFTNYNNYFAFEYISDILFLINGNTGNNFSFNESGITQTNTILGQTTQITVIGEWQNPSTTTSSISVTATDETDSTNTNTFLNLNITKLTQNSFDLSGVRDFYDYTDNIEFDTSGGSSSGNVNYVLKHTEYGTITVPGDTLTQDIYVSSTPYTVIATKLGDANYNDISATHTFTVQRVNQSSFDLSGVRDFYDYTDNIEFDTSGGSSSGNVNYVLKHTEYGTITVPGDTLTQDISASSTTYTVVATKLGAINYNDISATDTFTVQKINQSPITITNDISYVYSENQIIDITTTGGSINDDIVITINDVADTQLVNPDVGTYTIVASSAGNINYNPVSDSIDIEIKQTYQDLLQFTTQPQYVYSPDQTINLTATGGSGDGEITFNVTTTNGSLGTITELTNPDVGEYTIEAIKQESNNYFSTTRTTSITIIKATQDQLVNETTTEFTYSPELVIDLSASGGSTNNPILFTIDGTETTQLITPSIGNYSIKATKLGNQNYEDVLLNFSVNVTKSTQDSLSLSPSIVFYELLSGTVQLTITGGLDTIDPIVTTTSKFITIDGTILTYTRPEIVTLHVTKPGSENYSDVSGDFRFEIVKSMDHLRNTLHTRPRDLFNDPNITTNDILNYYTVEELLDNNITNVLVPDPRNGFSVRELREMGVGACAIYNTGKIRLIDLQHAGYKVKVCLH